jgi:hypothetical protein
MKVDVMDVNIGIINDERDVCRIYACENYKIKKQINN